MRGRLQFQPAPNPDARRSEPAANPLFRNILRVTHLNPIFCEHKTYFRSVTRLNSIFYENRSKNHAGAPFRPNPCTQTLHLRGHLSSQLASTPDVRRSEPAANSLFHNILRVTHLFPIFCEYQTISKPATHLISIFYVLRSKNHEHAQTRASGILKFRGQPHCLLD